MHMKQKAVISTISVIQTWKIIDRAPFSKEDVNITTSVSLNHIFLKVIRAISFLILLNILAQWLYIGGLWPISEPQHVSRVSHS